MPSDARVSTFTPSLTLSCSARISAGSASTCLDRPLKSPRIRIRKGGTGSSKLGSRSSAASTSKTTEVLEKCSAMWSHLTGLLRGMTRVLHAAKSNVPILPARRYHGRIRRRAETYVPNVGARRTGRFIPRAGGIHRATEPKKEYCRPACRKRYRGVELLPLRGPDPSRIGIVWR